MAKISIVVVDDHPIFRQGVVDTLSLEPDFAIVGQAASAGEALELVSKLSPIVAIVDLNLPDFNGQQLTRQLHEAKSHTRVVLLTAYDDSSQEWNSIAAGAAAYCAKDVHPETLVRIVRSVAEGRYVVAEQVLDREALQRWQAERANPISPLNEAVGLEPLSGREMEVLACITRGLSNKEIARDLAISHQTVKNHVTAVLRKLKVEDRTQAAVFALRQGWVQVEKPS
ncbi:MAG: response regulator transcription factor [Anaerolineales bacterium]|nr:response regulator transcription factor [Anaerolineales bacterium]MCW5854794.1 response regulator transcription factor [Anaerolineales bacterium]